MSIAPPSTSIPVVRRDAKLYLMIPREVRNVIEQSVCPGQPIEYYKGGYDAAAYAHAIAEAQGNSELASFILQSAWAYAYRIASMAGLI